MRKQKIKKLKVKKRGSREPLLTMCVPVTNLDEDRVMVMSLIKTVLANDLEGLSANQCGYNKQVFITKVKGDRIRVFINPIVTIVDFDLTDLDHEQCESYNFPCLRQRHTHVIVDAQNLKGERFILDTSDPLYPSAAAVRLAGRIQHEMEHLFGLDVRQEPAVTVAGQKALADLLEQPPLRVPGVQPSARIETQQLVDLGIGIRSEHVRRASCVASEHDDHP